LGYAPDDTGVSRKEQEQRKPILHSVKIKIKDFGLKVRARSVFSEMPGNLKPVALPFDSGDLGVTATPLPFFSPNRESIVRTMLHISGKDLSFESEPEDGYRITKVNIGCDLRQYGMSRGSYSGSFTFRVPVRGFEERVRQDFDTGFDIPVVGAGIYELRITAQQNEGRTVRTGMTSSLFEVPDFAHAGLAASGIATFNKKSVSKSDEPPITRRILRAEPFTCSLYIYNAHRVGSESKVKLETQLRLYQDEKLIRASEMIPVSDCEAEMISKGIPLGFDISPNAGLKAGSYLLEILVFDRLADGKHAVAAQSAAIELVD
jgi:hypothetical protein